MLSGDIDVFHCNEWTPLPPDRPPAPPPDRPPAPPPSAGRSGSARRCPVHCIVTPNDLYKLFVSLKPLMQALLTASLCDAFVFLSFTICLNIDYSFHCIVELNIET